MSGVERKVTDTVLFHSWSLVVIYLKSLSKMHMYTFWKKDCLVVLCKRKMACAEDKDKSKILN